VSGAGKGGVGRWGEGGVRFYGEKLDQRMWGEGGVGGVGVSTK